MTALLRELRPRRFKRHSVPYLRDRLARRRYRELSEDELHATRTSDTAWVLGSGRSVNELAPDEWTRIAAEANTISFSEFQRQSFVRADYHLVGEVLDLAEYAALLRQNPLYANTVYVVQEGWRARDANGLVGRGLLPPGSRIFRYRRRARGAYAPPGRTFSEGLTHGWNSSIDAANFAIALGFRRVVFAGVDLYDRGYFWQPEGERRANVGEHRGLDEPFPTSAAVVDLFRRWRALLEPEGIELSVRNPGSMLSEALEVFSW